MRNEGRMRKVSADRSRQAFQDARRLVGGRRSARTESRGAETLTEPVPPDSVLQRCQYKTVSEAWEIAGWNQTLEAPTAKLNKDFGPHRRSPGGLLGREGL